MVIDQWAWTKVIIYFCAAAISLYYRLYYTFNHFRHAVSEFSVKCTNRSCQFCLVCNDIFLGSAIEDTYCNHQCIKRIVDTAWNGL